MKLSVIVPVYNEAASIISVLGKVRAQKVSGVDIEIIVVDDGSTDGSVDLLKANPDLYDVLHCQEKNGGKGAAVREGLRLAGGDYVIFQDADEEYDPDDYARLMVPVTRFDAGIVMGSRMAGGDFTRVHYFWHRLGNKIITLLFNIFHNTTFTDIYCGYLILRRDLVDPERLRTSGWEQQAEILSKAVKRQTGIYEVPITYRGRTYEEGKKIRPHHIFVVIWTIARQAMTR